MGYMGRGGGEGRAGCSGGWLGDSSMHHDVQGPTDTLCCRHRCGCQHTKTLWHACVCVCGGGGGEQGGWAGRGVWGIRVCVWWWWHVCVCGGGGQGPTETSCCRHRRVLIDLHHLICDGRGCMCVVLALWGWVVVGTRKGGMRRMECTHVVGILMNMCVWERQAQWQTARYFMA